MSNYSLWIYLLIYFLLLATLYVMKSVLKVILITIMTMSKMFLFSRLSWKLRNLKNDLQLSSSENNHSTKNRFLTELTFKKYINIWISLQNYIIFSHYIYILLMQTPLVLEKIMEIFVFVLHYFGIKGRISLFSFSNSISKYLYI